MKEKVSVWFEVSVSYKKMQEDGTEKKVTEIVTVDAVSFAEAEKRALKEMGSIVRGGRPGWLPEQLFHSSGLCCIYPVLCTHWFQSIQEK